MATISSSGIGSGLDVESIITKLMTIERQPVVDLQTKATTIQNQVSEFGKIRSAMSTFRDAAQKLTNLDTWALTTATSSDANSVSVTTATGASPGNYSLTVSSLATSQALASGVFASSSATVGAGTLHIEQGTWGAGQNSFTAKTGGTALDVTVAATDTLAQVRDKINMAGAGSGVTATIFSDSTGSRLMLRSSATGTDSAFRIAVTDTGDGVNNDASGLSALSYDTASGAKQMSQTQVATNAIATINGLPVNSQSNTLTNVVDGVTVKLTGTTAAPVTISVTQDFDTIKKGLQSFADAYNALSTILTTDTKYDATTKTGGPLQGDSSVLAMQRTMRNLAGASSNASSVFSRLADIGLSTGADGSMSVNDTKVANAINNPAELKKVLINSDALDKSKVGLMRQFRNFGDSILAFDGSLTTRTNGMQARIQSNSDQQSRLNDRIAQTEKRIRAQYTALDATMGQLTGLSSYITQQVAQYNNGNK